jgi:ATP-dependent Clp protease ATP-binding subunit ClpA
MFQKLRARLGDVSTITRVLQDAETIARREGLEQPGAEHLVLAALRLDDGTARAALERAGASADAFASAVRDQHAVALGTVGVVADDDLIDASLPEPGSPSGVYRSDTSAQELFQRAGDEARAEGGGLLGAHVLGAAAELEHGTVARAFEHLGIDRAILRESASAEIAAARSR